MIGIENKGVVKATPKKEPNSFGIKQWTKKHVEDDLNEQIEILAAGRGNYKTVSKLAAGYRLTSKAFRNRCSEDTDLMNLFEIYNGVYVEHIMTQAIKEGKINSQTEEFLKEEMQAYTNTGTEQLVQWIVSDKNEQKFYAYNEDTGQYDKEIQIIDDNETHDNPWDKLEVENE